MDVQRVRCNMTAEQYLDQIKKLDTMIRNKLKDYHRWVEVAEGIGGASVGERVQSTRNLHKIPDAIGNYVDIENEVQSLKAERQAIIKTIEQLPTTEYDLLYQHYVNYYTMKELAFHFGMSYEWVKVKRREALKHLQSVLDAQTSTERR